MTDDDEKLAGLREKWNERAKDRSFTGPMDLLFDKTGYITIGYYLTGDETVGQSAQNMTTRLAEISNISAESRVLDLGCGKGAPVLDIAVKTGASVVGVDLAENHIEFAKVFLAKYRVRNPEIQAEFHVGSYYDIPAAVKSLAPFTHVIMQTSIFYAHHRIDDVLSQVSSVLAPGSGLLVTTDFLRNVPLSEVIDFATLNSMSTVLNKDEMEVALKRNGLEYVDGEVLDSHCIKCNVAKRNKVDELSLQGPSKEFFKSREEYVRNGKISFQLVVARKQ